MLESFLERQKRGERVKQLEKFPDLHDGLRPYWNAFQLLSRRRANSGFAIGAIPFSEIREYLKDIEDEDDREIYMQLIEALDVKYIELVNARLKSEADVRARRREQTKS